MSFDDYKLNQFKIVQKKNIRTQQTREETSRLKTVSPFALKRTSAFTELFLLLLD